MVKLATVAALVLLGCGKGEPPIEKERRALRAALEAPELLLYRALKVYLRALPADILAEPGSSPEKLGARLRGLPQGEDLLAAREMIRLGAQIFAQLSGRQPEQPLTLKDAVALARELRTLKKKIGAIDEDRYPTLLDNIFAVGKGDRRAALPWYNAAYEHSILALAWIASRVAPRSFAFYETSKLDPAALAEPELRLAARLVRGLLFFKEGWHHLADEELTGYLEVVDSGPRAADGAAGRPNRHEAALVKAIGGRDPLLTGAGLRALGLGLRGVNRRAMGDEKRALDDLDAALAQAKKAGLENELVWLAGVYVSLKRDRMGEADAYLAKLEGSAHLAADEKKIVKEARAHLAKRDPKRVLAGLDDRVFLGRLLVSAGGALIRRSERYRALEGSPAGARLIRSPELIQRRVDNLQRGLGTERVKELGQAAGETAKSFLSCTL